MIDESEVGQLLEELANSNATPEIVCAGHPELLTVVRQRWQEMLGVQAKLDALFPSLNETISQPIDASAHPQIPGYEVDVILGHGGMGIVYRARHLRLNRMVALKMALAGAFAGTRERDRFQREVEAIARLRHPNVVQIYDVSDIEGRPYFTMELVEAGSLAQKLAGTPLPANEAARLTSILAGAVHAAHTSGVVHRDLKPANVLLTNEGIPKISDFGLARSVDDGAGLTQTGVAIGTPSYMAPEQARGQVSAVGPTVDVYSLGAILYELLTGRPPFRGATAVETVRQVIEQDPVPPSRFNARIPRDLQTVCLKCLQKDSRLRYSTAHELEEDLNRFLRGESVSARPERWFGWVIRRIRRQPKQAAALAVSAMLAVTAIVGGALLLSERAAAARAVAADQKATDRAAAQDLAEMVKSLKKSAWPEAEAALQRAKVRLGERGSADLHRIIDQGTRDLALQQTLDQLRTTYDASLDFRVSSGPLHQVSTGPFDQENGRHFREAGLGQTFDDPTQVAEKIRDSNICNALVDALDHWGTITKDRDLRKWVWRVAQLVDEDASGWRMRVRDDSVATDKQTLISLATSAKIEDHRVPALLILSKRMAECEIDQEPYLRRLQKAHPGDVWVNVRLAATLLKNRKFNEAAGFLHVVLAIRPESSMFHINAASIFFDFGNRDEGIYHLRLAHKLDPQALHVRQNFGLLLSEFGQHDEALTYLPVAIGEFPSAGQLHEAYGRSLASKGREINALAEFQQAIDLDPQNIGYQRHLRRLLMKLKRPEEARVAWSKALELEPSDHDAWYGYAEYCLFLGKQDEYIRARQALLKMFGTTNEPKIAERAGRACLLLPLEGEELTQAVGLTEHAAGSAQSKQHAYYPYFQFAHGLAVYRQGQFQRAISVMRGEASKVLGPAPKLVLAMSLHQTGQSDEARKVLAEAIHSHDWKLGEGDDPSDWVCHILRHEAEGLILPRREM